MTPQKKDNRIKLLPAEKAIIIAEHNSGLTMYRIGKMHNIAALTVANTLHPEKLAEKRLNEVVNKEKALIRLHRHRAKVKAEKEAAKNSINTI